MAEAQLKLGKKLSDEQKAALSAAMKLRHENGGLVGVYRKIALKNTGKKASAETRAKMSAWQKGKPKGKVLQP